MDLGLPIHGDAFAGFGDPMMVLAAFATLFLIGCILADARVLTRSLWLPIGLHAGWIFAAARLVGWRAGKWLRCPGWARICSLESYLWAGRSNMGTHAAMVKT
jgi:CAAX amino terminal protease family.